MRIGIVGQGNVGRSLGALFRQAGHEVVFGVREPAVGQQTVPAAASVCDLAVLAVPFQAMASIAPEIRESLAGKVVVDATNPLGEDWAPLDLGSRGSAGEEIQRLLPDSSVVKAFNTVFADNFQPERMQVGSSRITAFVAGDDPAARSQVVDLAQGAGFDPVEVGALNNARYLEAIAHLNIQLAVGMERGTDSGFLYFHRG